MNLLRRVGRKPERRIVLKLADVHGGHTLGLFNPATVFIRDHPRTGRAIEWQPELTEVQERLWRLYLSQLRQVEEFAGEDEIVAFHLGDLTWGQAHPQGAIEGITQAEQEECGYQNLLPVLHLPTLRTLRLISGTYSHVPNSAEAKVAYRLAKDTAKDVQSVHHQRSSISGVVFDDAHHGPGPGSRDWLHGNIARFYLKDRVYRDRRNGRTPARIYARGHYHEWVHETVHDCWDGCSSDTDLTILPSYSGLTWFARKVTQSTPVLTNGLCCYEIVDGELVSIRPFLDSEDLRVEEAL